MNLSVTVIIERDSMGWGARVIQEGVKGRVLATSSKSPEEVRQKARRKLQKEGVTGSIDFVDGRPPSAS
jgi:hypothetical protein